MTIEQIKERNSLKLMCFSNLDFMKAVGKASYALYQGDSLQWDNLVSEYGKTLVAVANDLNKSRWRRTRKCKIKVGEAVIGGNAIFLTLTFKDAVLASTSKETRRRYVSRFLKANSDLYVANIDYGAKNHREHYHAIVKSDIVDLKGWTFGAINAARIRNKNLDLIRSCKYVDKLTNHCLKSSTSDYKLLRATRLIYSRNLKNALEREKEE